MRNSLILAIENDDFEEAHKLIQENKNNIINQPDFDGNFPLHLTTNFSLYGSYLPNSIKSMLSKLSVLLLEAGANPNIKDGYGSSPIHYVAINGDLNLFKELINYGADYNTLDAAKESPLHQAIRRKNDDIVEFLLSKDLQFEKTIEGHSPIDYAKRYNLIIMRMIEDKFADFIPQTDCTAKQIH